MRIAIVSPGVSPSGGIRVLFQHANLLAQRGHEVYIVCGTLGRPAWFPLAVPIIGPRRAINESWDVAVATEWQTVNTVLEMKLASRRYYFVQMMEHLFYLPGNENYKAALRSYALAFANGVQPITISDWLAVELTKFGFGRVPVIPNGVELDVFHPSATPDPRNYVLVEGDGRNQAKDVEGIGWRVATSLRQRYGVEVVGYAGVVHQWAEQCDSFALRPSAEQMRQLYSGARFLVKASRFEGRSLAPLESLACGTPIARAIIAGDDDIQDGVNARREPYEFWPLFEAACELYENTELRDKLARRALEYAQANLRWEDKIVRLEDCYSGGAGYARQCAAPE